MSDELSYWILCFVPLNPTSETRIFGFAEFIAALALLVLLYMVADIRYKFRLSVTPGYLHVTTFALIAVIGFESLLSELWRAAHWWVPETVGLTQSIWQAIFGALFLSAFLTWLYYAFIRPPVFSRRTAKRYAQTLYRIVLKGSDEELAVISNELARSAGPLVKLSRTLRPQLPMNEEAPPPETKPRKRKPSAGNYAHDLLLLIANKKLCRHMVASSPVTALVLFDTMTAGRGRMH
jgi:hypothetical protein